MDVQKSNFHYGADLGPKMKWTSKSDIANIPSSKANSDAIFRWVLGGDDAACHFPKFAFQLRLSIGGIRAFQNEAFGAAGMEAGHEGGYFGAMVRLNHRDGTAEGDQLRQRREPLSVGMAGQVRAVEVTEIESVEGAVLHQLAVHQEVGRNGQRCLPEGLRDGDDPCQTVHPLNHASDLMEHHAPTVKFFLGEVAQGNESLDLALLDLEKRLRVDMEFQSHFLIL
jgi:hypothetical protein